MPNHSLSGYINENIFTFSFEIRQLKKDFLSTPDKKVAQDKKKKAFKLGDRTKAVLSQHEW